MYCKRNLLSFVLIAFIWRICNIKAYVDVCEYNSTNVECNCEKFFYNNPVSDYKVICIISQNVSKTDSVWQSLVDSQNISYMHLKGLEYIPPDLKRLPNLKILEIANSQLQTLKSYDFSSFMSLKALNLENNMIEILEPHAISNIPNLEEIVLSKNWIHEIQPDALDGLIRLEELNLHYNEFSRVEACAFGKLQNLKTLWLSKNKLSELTEFSFQGFTNLEYLILEENQIQSLNDNVFRPMERLISLDLRTNLISYISERAFHGLSKLQLLYLDHNRIKTLPDAVFAPLVSLKYLSLSFNELEIIQEEVTYSLQISKNGNNTLCIDGNPFRCSCTMQWVSDYHNEYPTCLEELKCKFANETTEMLEYLKNENCSVTVTTPILTPPLNTDLITKPTSAPVELSTQTSSEREIQSSTSVTTIAGDKVTDEGHIRKAVEEETKMTNASETGRSTMNYGSLLVIFLALFTVCS